MRQPSIATLEWARVIADGYLSYHTRLGNKRREAGLLTNDDGFLTMSVIDLKRVRDINLQLELTSPGLEEYVQQSEQNWVNVARERASSTSFGGETTMQNGAFDIVDLGVFADRLAEAQIQPEDYRRLSSAIRQAVVYRANGKLAARTSGLGAYFPSRNISLDTMTQTYSKLGMPKQYKSLLRTYAAYTNLKPAVIQLDLLKSQPGALQAKITSSFGVSQAYSAISVATGMSYVVRIVAASPVPLPQVLFGDIGFRLDTEWAMLNGRPVCPTLFDRSEPSQGGALLHMYGLPALLNGVRTTLAFRFDSSNGQWLFSGSWTGPDHELAPRLPDAVSPDDLITLLGVEFDTVTKEFGSVVPTDEPFAAGTLTMSAEKLSRDSYRFHLLVRDFADNFELSDAVPWVL